MTIVLISWNVNGIRAVERKEELQKVLRKEKPDVLFLQETKAQPDQLSAYLVNHQNYHQEYHSAEQKGYSGVSVWLNKVLFPQKPKIVKGMEGWNDHEGRVIRFDHGEHTFLGVYFPNGGKSEAAWQEKIRFYDHFLEHINSLRKKGKKVIFCGDLNVAHNEIDLARPKENQKSIGFLPEERSWVDRLIQANWVDVFRHHKPNEVSYTWWDMPSRARERNIGWRIDYFFVDKELIPNIKADSHLSQQLGSDHCPVLLKMEI